MILYLEILYARMSSTDNIKEIDKEYILSYQECQITTSVVFDTKQMKSSSVRMTDDRWIVLRKSQVDKIYPIVDFVTRVVVVCVVFCLESGFFCFFCLFRVEKG